MFQVHLGEFNVSDVGKEIGQILCLRPNVSSAYENCTIDYFNSKGTSYPSMSKTVNIPSNILRIFFSILHPTPEEKIQGYTLDKILTLFYDNETKSTIVDFNTSFFDYVGDYKFYPTRNANYILSTSNYAMIYTTIYSNETNTSVTIPNNSPYTVGGAIYDGVFPLSSNRFQSSFYDNMDYGLQFSSGSYLTAVKAVDLKTGYTFQSSFSNYPAMVEGWPCVNDVDMDGALDVIFSTITTKPLHFDVFFGNEKMPLFPERAEIFLDWYTVDDNITDIFLEPHSTTNPYGGVILIVVQSMPTGEKNFTFYNVTITRERTFKYDCDLPSEFIPTETTDYPQDSDSEPVICGDSTSTNLLMVWSTSNGWDLPALNTSDLDLVYSFSSDSGKTWTTPKILNTNAKDDTIEDRLPTCIIGNDFMMVVWPEYSESSEFNVFYSSVSKLSNIHWTDPMPIGRFNSYNTFTSGSLMFSNNQIVFSSKHFANATMFTVDYPRFLNVSDPQSELVISNWNTVNISNPGVVERIMDGSNEVFLILTVNTSAQNELYIESTTNISSNQPRTSLATFILPPMVAYVDDYQLKCNTNNHCLLVLISKSYYKMMIYHSYNGYNWSSATVIDCDLQDTVSGLSLNILENSSFLITVGYDQSIINTFHLVTFTNDPVTPIPVTPFPVLNNKRSVQENLYNISIDHPVRVSYKNGSPLTHYILQKQGYNTAIISLFKDARGILSVSSCLSNSDVLNVAPPLGSPTGSPLGSPFGSPLGSPLGSPISSPVAQIPCFENFTGSSLINGSDCNNEGILYTNSLTTLTGEDVIIKSNWQWTTPNTETILTIVDSNITLYNDANIETVTTIIGNLTIVNSTLNFYSTRVELTGNLVLLGNSTINLNIPTNANPNQPLISVSGCFNSTGRVNVGVAIRPSSSTTVSVIQSSCLDTDVSKVSMDVSKGCTSSKPQVVQRGLNYVLVVPDFTCSVNVGLLTTTSVPLLVLLLLLFIGLM
eukprot:TRINITY_DN6050_c0_g1_i1.p1 TRINITY_DN6050_c0_g1~~TRINITY_DN6050_c0_g1_i1.p1  ORF type:complete len:993 (-),score=147.78 TRINITY_DN6050_c0_g1_i1:36-3014(-)